MPITCKLCGKKYQVLAPSHLKYAHNGMAKKEYQEMFPNAPIASSEFRQKISRLTEEQWANPITRATILAANREAAKDPERNQKISKKAKKRWANPQFKAQVAQKIIETKNTPEYRNAQSKRSKALWEDPEYRTKTIEAGTAMKQDSVYKQMMSEILTESCNDPDYRADLSKRTEERWAEPEFKEKMLNILQSPEYRAKQSQKMLELWKTEEHQEAWLEGAKKQAKSMKQRPTNPELELFRFLNDNSYPYIYIGDGSLWIGIKNPDFIWPEQRKLIEMYGSHPWHNEDEIDPRIEYLANYGFDLLVIWDYELKDTDQLLTKLKAFHK